MTSYPQKITLPRMRATGVRDVLIYCRDLLRHPIEADGCALSQRAIDGVAQVEEPASAAVRREREEEWR
jgi:hypothetical protein